MRRLNRSLLGLSAMLVAGLAVAQPLGSYRITTPQIAYGHAPAQSDAQLLSSALEAARYGDGARVRSTMSGIQDPLARKIALWALVDAAPATMSFLEADNARRDLAGWPRAARREMAAENQLDLAGYPPRDIISWFGGGEPTTGRGALALATALNASGQGVEATAVIRKSWRGMAFDVETQNAIAARFGAVLTTADHVAREDMLLYGAQGDAAQDMLRYLPADQRAIATARMAVRRSGVSGARAQIDALPFAARTSPGLAYEMVLSLSDRGDLADAVALTPYISQTLPEAAGERLWKHGSLVTAALRSGDTATAYAIAAHTGLTEGRAAAEAEFYAGWIALTRRHDARTADIHFAKLQSIGESPLTQSRALYWRGRAADAMGDAVAAQLFYGQAARYYTTFYGQLAAARVGVTTLSLPKDPPITAADRARFEGREVIRAARYLEAIGARDTFRTFVAALSETLPTVEEEALLVDLARGYGEQEASMRVVRNAAKRGFILPERGYPIRTPPQVSGGAETPFVLGITRQESGFDARARSGAGARGMMQLMPATAAILARRLGLPFSADQLDDPDYNMQLGSAYLGQLVGRFSGSYVMASAAYNAGPGRPAEWSGPCGDPRGSSTDPLDFIECIPFSETRDYVMRVLEATQVYRARLGGGAAPMTLAEDLKRGAYRYRAAAVLGAGTGGGTSVASVAGRATP